MKEIENVYLRLSAQDLVGCWIDGAVPRSPWQRCSVLGALLDRMKPEEFARLISHPEVASWGDEEWTDFEDELIQAIEGLLPNDLEIHRNAGDVVVHKKDHVAVYKGETVTRIVCNNTLITKEK